MVRRRGCANRGYNVLQVIGPRGWFASRDRRYALDDTHNRPVFFVNSPQVTFVVDYVRLDAVHNRQQLIQVVGVGIIVIYEQAVYCLVAISRTGAAFPLVFAVNVESGAAWSSATQTRHLQDLQRTTRSSGDSWVPRHEARSMMIQQEPLRSYAAAHREHRSENGLGFRATLPSSPPPLPLTWSRAATVARRSTSPSGAFFLAVVHEALLAAGCARHNRGGRCEPARCSVVWCQRDDDSRQSRAVRFADWSEHRTEILIDSSIPRFHCCSTHSLSAQDAHKKYAAKTTTKDHGLLFRNRCLLFRRTICRRLRRRTGASAMWTGSNTSSSL